MARLYLNPLNPIALREMKARVRGPRTFALLAAYMLVLGLAVFVVYIRKGANTTYNYGVSLSGNNFGPTRTYETGQDIFISVFMFLMVVIAVVTPAICGGLVSREMEDRTYDLLVVTPIRGRALIYGKLIAALGYISMLVLAAVPIACVVFIFGGVKVEHLIAGFAIVLMEAIVFGILSLFFSALFRRTSVAIIVTYSVNALLLLGVPIASSSLVSTINSDTNRIPSGVRVDPRTDPAFDLPKRMLVLNPFAALGSVLAPNAPYRSGVGEELQYFPNSKLYWGDPVKYFATPTFPPNSIAGQLYSSSKLPVLPVPRGLAFLGEQIPLWNGYLLVYTAIGLFFLILSMGVVKPLPRRSGISLLKVARRVPLPKLSRRAAKTRNPGPLQPTLARLEGIPSTAAPGEIKPAQPMPVETALAPEERPKRQALG